jgi:alpha-L-rhamnosidase
LIRSEGDMVNICWKAKWIWKEEEKSQNDFAYFRREFRLTDRIKTAKVYVSAHNHFKLYVNGQGVGGLVSPAPSNPYKSKYYLTYDVSDSLKEGANSLCAVVHYIGGGGQNYVDGYPGFFLQCEVLYENDCSETIITDENWKALSETPYKNYNKFQQNRRISSIEEYDSRRENAKWIYDGFDDSSWKASRLSQINMEDWQLKEQKIPEGSIDEIIIPRLLKNEEEIYIYDAGKIVTGWPKIELKGIADSRVQLRYSEDLDESGRVKHNVCNETSENYFDVYIMNGSEKEIWEPNFSYKSFRYIEVTGYPGKILDGQIKVIAAHTGLKYEGSFTCSNNLFNEIYEACIQTQKNNIPGQIVDCPHREQAQYLADSDLQAETLLYNFDSRAMLEKVLGDFKDGQLEDGRYSFVYPSNTSNKDFDIKIPEWDLHYCSILWKLYCYYGDREILDDYYNSAAKMLNYYLGLIDGTGLVPVAEGWHISDWPYPNIEHKGDYLTVQNCSLFNTLNIMEKAAAVLGREKDVEFYLKEAEKLKNAILKYFYKKNKKRFLDSIESTQSHQGTNVVAYQWGLVPAEDKAEVLNFIVSEGMNCKTLLSLNLFQILFENGREEEAYRLLNSTNYPGWGHMKEKGYKTIWEGFDNIESHSHAWNGYPARLFMEYLTGIRASNIGLNELELRPLLFKKLDSAEAKVVTDRGIIYLSWRRCGEEAEIEISIPQGTKGKLFIPKEYGADVIELNNGSFSYKFLKKI